MIHHVLIFVMIKKIFGWFSSSAFLIFFVKWLRGKITSKKEIKNELINTLHDLVHYNLDTPQIAFDNALYKIFREPYDLLKRNSMKSEAEELKKRFDLRKNELGYVPGHPRALIAMQKYAKELIAQLNH